MLSSRRALQISGTIVASLEKSIFLRYLQAPFNTLYSLVISLLSQTLLIVTNFIWSYLHQFFDDSHSIKTSLKPLRRPFD